MLLGNPPTLGLLGRFHRKACPDTTLKFVFMLVPITLTRSEDWASVADVSSFLPAIGVEEDVGVPYTSGMVAPGFRGLGQCAWPVPGPRAC